MHRYGKQHKQLRRRLERVVKAGLATCCRCSGPIHPDSEWHLDHTDDGRDYLGVAHKRCNLREAGKARMAQLDGKRVLGRRFEPADPQAAAIWRAWWSQRPTLGPDTWSRHWDDDSVYDGRCPRCREFGRACGDADAPGIVFG